MKLSHRRTIALLVAAPGALGGSLRPDRRHERLADRQPDHHANTWQDATNAMLLREEQLTTGMACHVEATSKQGNSFEAWIWKTDGSRAEFSPVKQHCVRLAHAWVSDRVYYIFRRRLRRTAWFPRRWRMAAPGSCCPARRPGLPRASPSPSCLTGINDGGEPEAMLQLGGSTRAGAPWCFQPVAFGLPSRFQRAVSRAAGGGSLAPPSTRSRKLSGSPWKLSRFPSATTVATRARSRAAAGGRLSRRLPVRQGAQSTADGESIPARTARDGPETDLARLLAKQPVNIEPV